MADLQKARLDSNTLEKFSRAYKACVSSPGSSALDMEQAVLVENSLVSCDFLCALDVVEKRMRRLFFRDKSMSQ